MKYLFSILLLLFATNGYALSFSEITGECDERKGNETALKQFADSIEGERVSLKAKLEEIKNTLIIGSYAKFEVEYPWKLDVYLSDEKAMELRIGNMYEFDAMIESHTPFGSGLKVSSPGYGYPWACDNLLELKEATFD